MKGFASAICLAFLGLAGATGMDNACNELNTSLPGKVVFPAAMTYNNHLNYWSNRQSELTPNCFISPADKHDVSQIITIIKRHNAPFTVKSGGHHPYPSSNIDDGITIDMVNMNELRLSPNDRTVVVSPGNRWRDIAALLDPLGLAVVGGRVAEIGVSGLTLGGGISWFGGRYGWAADNVVDYEVVIPDGSIIHANKLLHRDMYWALRGGGAQNFGIVTQFRLAVIEQGNVWYKEAAYPPTETNNFIQMFSDMCVDDLPNDPDAHPVMFAAYQGGLGVLTQFFRWHTVPPINLSTVPAIYQPFEALPELPGAKNASLTVSDMLNVYQDPSGARKGWWDTSIAAESAIALQKIVAHYGEWVVDSFNNNPNIIAVLLIQPIAKTTIQQMQKNGGNPLPLHPAMRIPMKVTTYITWFDPALDAEIGAKATQATADFENIARNNGAWNGGFVYLNYADREQDVYSRYRPFELARLRNIRQRYDPDDTLKNLWKGFFKL